MKRIKRTLWLAAVCLGAVTARAEGLVLTQAVQVLKLSIAEAQSGLPVVLRGVLVRGGQLASDTTVHAVIHDASGSVVVRADVSQAGLLARTNIMEVRGVTRRDGFAAIVVARELKVLGRGEIPIPRRVTYEELMTGRLDSQWVEVSGCLRSCVLLPPSPLRETRRMSLQLATGGGRLMVEVSRDGVSPEWVDGTVRVRGLCFHWYNNKQQLYQMLLKVPDGEPVVLEEAPTPLSLLPTNRIGSLLQYAQEGNFGHRVRVNGVVTHQHPGSFLYLHDGNRGLFVGTRQKTTAMPGDEVSVVGFPAQGDYSPILEDAEFEVLSHGNRLPAPVPVQHLNEAFEHDTELISGSAKLIGSLPTDDGWELSLQMEGSVFTALLGRSSPSQTGPKFELGSQIGFTGVCAVVMGPSIGTISQTPVRIPKSIQVRLRSEQDLQLIRSPPWWTAQRILIAATMIVLALTAGIAVVVLIARTRLQRQQAGRRQAETEFAAVHKERNRMAREIHDTLAQNLSGISVQLEVARKILPVSTEAAAAHLNRAQAAARSSLQEVRRSIFNMRSQALEGRDLGAALAELLECETQGTGIQHSSAIRGEVRPLPSTVENDLLRIGQEAIHNSIRHARPASLKLELAFTDQQVELTIRDDGCGFDPEGTKLNGQTRFGLKGMRERAQECGGHLTIRSAPGQGTEIAISVLLT